MILDTNHDVTNKLGPLKALGYTHLIRYIATGSKSIMPTEARAIAAAGIQLVTVYEAWGDTHGELTAALGVQHARDYVSRVEAIGQPLGSGVYFAVDNDESATSIQNRILPYFQAITSVIAGRYRVGVYGSGNVNAAMLDAGYAKLSWLANAVGWGGYAAYRASGRWNILQHVPKTIAGLDTDPDEINPARPDIGAFMPFGPPVGTVDPPKPVHDVAWLQGRLNAAGATPPLATDGNAGRLTIAAMIAYVENKEATA